MLIKDFEDFNVSRFMSTSPPSDYSFDTMQEIKELERMPRNKRFVKEKDDIKKKICSGRSIRPYEKKRGPPGGPCSVCGFV